MSLQHVTNPLARHRAEALVANYKMTPATLYNKIDPNWIPKSFLLQASLKIAQTIAKPNGRLIISWPPRHGKSRLATIATPIWVLENFPSLDIVLATYGDSLSTDFGREVRDIFEANRHLLDERIRKDVKSVGKFKTTKGGGMLSVGLGGPITGKGADVFLIDDYIKTMAEALSPGKRDADWEWFTGTAYHRLEPNASMIIIATRWHNDDLIGRIKKNFPGEFDIIEFKAIAEEGDVLGREVGEALFPERYDISSLNNRKKVLGSVFFNAIFQQDPNDDDSKLTDRDWIEIVDTIPMDQNLKFARIWDFGGGKGKENDPTVGMLCAVNERTQEMYIVDVYRKRTTPQTAETAVITKAMIDGTDTEVIIEREPGASGIQIVAHYETNVLPDYTVKSSPATTNKVTRAMPFLAAAEAGKVKILRRPWNDDFLDEFADFPAAGHDDQVDCGSIGYNTLLNKKPTSPIWGRQEEAAKRLPRLYNGTTLIKGPATTSGVTWGGR